MRTGRGWLTRMTTLLSWIDQVFDLSFRLMRPLPSFVVLAVFSVFTAVISLLAVRWTSDQKAIRRVKDLMGAHVLEVRLFPDQLSVVLRAYLTLFGNTLLYLRYALVPLLVLSVPLLILFAQLEAYFGRAPVEPGQDFLVRATFQTVDSLEDPVLRLPPGLVQSAPPVHIPSEREVDWRVKAEQPGTYDIHLVLQGSEFSKRVVAESGLTRIVSERERGSVWQQIINPGEPPLPRAGLVEQIAIQYAPRVFHFRTWEIEWLVPYLVLTLAAALLLKGTLRTEL
jgi:hypothetical protein